MSSSSSHLSQQQQQHQHQQQQHLSPHKSSQVADSVVHSAEACLAKCEELAAKVASLNNAAPGPQTVVATNKMTINITNTNLSSTAPTATTMPIPRDQVAPSSCATESALSVPAHYHQSRPAQEIVVAFAPTNTTSRRPSNQAASNDSKYHSQQATTPSHQQKQLQHPQQQSTSSTGNVLAMVNPDTRTHVVGELYDTERSYVESLQILIEKYMKPLKSLDNKSLIESNLVDEIFYTIPEILDHHERFLNALQERLADDWDSSQVIGNVFIEAFTNQQIIDTYTKFINNWKNAKHAIKVAIQAKPAFERFLEAMSREHRNKLTLDALLIMPVQRIPRYELLIKELIKHTPHDHPDHGPLMEAQKEIHELALKIDRAEKEMIHQEQLKDLEALIEGHVELQHPQRDFIRYDLVTISASTLTVAKKERVLFLFCDLLIMTSVKKKVSRRSNLQAAFANSDHDISLLEGNKFKLILRVSLDQVDIKCDTHDQTQLWQQQQQHQQQYHEQQLVALAQRKKLIQGTKRELESDLFVLQQMEHLSNQLTRADKANLINNIGDSMEQIRIKLSNLEQQNSDCENYAEQQQQLSLQHSAQLAQDLYIIQTPVVQQNQGLQQPSNNSLSLSLSRDHHNSLQVQSSTPSGGSDQDHTSKQHTDASLEFIINNNLTASKEFLDANLNSSISLIGGVEAPLEQELSGSGLINSPTPESQHQQLTSGNTNCESLVVSFPSRDRRQAFIQAFLEAKQVRLMQRQYQQHQKMFSSSNIVRLSQLEHPLMKSRSMASDMRRNRLQHQDEVLDIRFSDPLGKHTDKRHEDRISSAPCATTIVHQMSVPLCIDTSYDKQLIATHCGVSRSSNCTLDSSDKCQHRQHNSHHHHQLMHQPASHPALLHTICCHESHNDAMDHHSTKSLSIKLDQQMTDRGGERASMEQNNYVRGVIDQRSRTMHTDNRDGHEDESIISLLQNDLDKCNQINDQILMLKFVPRFLTALPMNFLNTQHPALQLTCSISRKFNLDDKNNYCGVNENTIRELRDVSNRVRCQTVSDNQGQLWLCMSNGYVSHISLIEFVAGRIGSRCNHEHSCSEHYIRPVIKAGGDICKSQINCAAQVGWSQTVIHSKDSHSGDRSKRIKPVGQDMNSLIKSDEEREQHHLDPISTKVSVKPTSPPVNIERKSQFTNSTQAKKISSSAPSTHDDTRPGTHAAGLSLSINEIKLSNSKRKNDSAKIKHTPRQPSSDSSTDAHPANLRHQTLQHHHHSQDQLHRCRNTNRQPPPLCNNNNGRPGHRGVYQLTGAAGHQQHQHQHHTHSHHHGHHQHHHHSHQMYHQKHHTVPLAELRLALERQSKLSASDKDQLSLPGGSHRDGNRLAPPANTPSPIEAGSVDSVNAPCLANNPVQSRKARSTTPPARHLSTGNKSLRSARQLRHQASLKTSSILAKLVGSAGRGSFYLKRSSTTRAHSNSKPHSDAEDNDTDTDQQHGSAAKQDETNALKDSNQSITNPNLLTATNSNANVNNNSIVSPLSSVSSLNSTNSSITVNSVCASSPNHGGCALLGLPQWSSTTCCSARNQSNCSSEDRQELSSPGEDFSGSIENCNIRSRSATVPCRAYCEQSMPEKVSYDPYKVSEIIDDSYSEMRNYEEGSNSATTRTTTTKNPTSIDKQTSLWLGCDDGSLIIIDCLRPDNQSCNACDIGPGQNMHSELKLGASISDIKNHLDRIVFVALADGRLVVFSRKTEDNGTLGEWQLTNPQILTITENELSSTSRLCVINENHLWYSYGRNISVLNISSLSLETTIMTPTNDKSIQFAMQTISINSMESVAQLDGVWVSFRGSPLIQFYESRDYKLLLEFSALEPINRILSCGNEIIRQHKTACLGATSLLSIYNETEDSNSLFIGTTAGLILVLTISRSQLQEQVESQKLVWNPQVISLRHGHSSSVKFLHLIELMRSPNGQEADRIVDRNNNNDGNNATLDDTDSNESQHNITPHRDYACTSTTKTSSLCLVSGGAGIDLYGPDDNQQILQHLSTDDDCLNHLILWEM